VLEALQEKLLNQELFDEFCQEFTREMNRLRSCGRSFASQASAWLQSRHRQARRRLTGDLHCRSIPSGIGFGAVEFGYQTLDKLARHLAVG